MAFIRFTLIFVLCFSSTQTFSKKVVRKIKIYDKMSLISHPLMKNATRSGDTVTFTWSEPHSDFKYFLEVYREGTPKPISIVSVNSGKKNLIFSKKQKKKLYWRIRAVSRHGHRNKNQKKMLVPLNYN